MLNIPSTWFRHEDSANKLHPFASLAWYLSDIEDTLNDEQTEQVQTIMEHVSKFEDQLITGEAPPVDVPALPRMKSNELTKEAFAQAVINSNMVNSITYEEFATLYHHMTNALRLCNEGDK